MLTATSARAQQTPASDTTETHVVTILHADSSTGYVQNGQRIRSLQGDVRLRQETTYLSADRVLQYVEQDSILFLGSVRIVDEGDTLTADRVLYNQRTQVGRAEGDVMLTDGEVVLRAPSGIYYVDEEWARFNEGVRMRDSVSVLTSQAGEYWFDQEKAVFYRDVRLRQEETTVRSDSLVHFRQTNRSLGFGNVVISHIETDTTASDTLRRLLLFGERVERIEPKGINRVTGDPLLVQFRFDSTGTDTMIVRAEKLVAIEKPDRRRLIGVGNVRFWQREFAGVADSVVYTRIFPEESQDTVASKKNIRLFGGPIAWMQQTQITGDTLQAMGRGEQIDSLIVRSDAFVASKDSLTGRIHQLRGRQLHASMEDNRLHYLKVGPNAEAIRFLTDENDQPNGALQMSSDYIEGWFEDGTLSRLEASGGIQGKYYAESILPEELRLEGFQWAPERRPMKRELLEEADWPLDSDKVLTRLQPASRDTMVIFDNIIR